MGKVHLYVQDLAWQDSSTKTHLTSWCTKLTRAVFLCSPDAGRRQQAAAMFRHAQQQKGPPSPDRGAHPGADPRWGWAPSAGDPTRGSYLRSSAPGQSANPGGQGAGHSYFHGRAASAGDVAAADSTYGIDMAGGRGEIGRVFGRDGRGVRRGGSFQHMPADDGKAGLRGPEGSRRDVLGGSAPMLRCEHPAPTHLAVNSRLELLQEGASEHFVFETRSTFGACLGCQP